jgi:hypothetical protein
VINTVKMRNTIRDAVAARAEKGDVEPEQAKSMKDLAGSIVALSERMETDTPTRVEGYNVLEATDGFQKLQQEMERWQVSIGLGNPCYEFRNGLKYIVEVFQEQGMSRLLCARKILETVPKTICPDTLSFEEFRTCVAYTLWRRYA